MTELRTEWNLNLPA